MTFSYSPSELTSRDQVRSLIGDTNSSDPLLADETIDAVLASTSSVAQAALGCVKRIIAKLSRDTDRNAAGISNTRSQKVQHYRDLLNQLQRDVGMSATMVAGGTSFLDRDLIESDLDFIRPPVVLGQDDLPGADGLRRRGWDPTLE